MRRMRITKNIFLILGILCILVNILGFLGGAKPLPIAASATTLDKIAFFIGTLMFFLLAYYFSGFPTGSIEK
jgi:hypothetical protein